MQRLEINPLALQELLSDDTFTSTMTSPSSFECDSMSDSSFCSSPIDFDSIDQPLPLEAELAVLLGERGMKNSESQQAKEQVSSVRDIPIVTPDLPPLKNTSVATYTSTVGKKRKAPPKKKQKCQANDNKSGPTTAVTLSKERLLVISSKEFELYENSHRQARLLTAEEEKDIKRMKRLIKNRESAQASRDRKKNELETLQKKVNELEEENKSLKAEVEQLRKENSQLIKPKKDAVPPCLNGQDREGDQHFCPSPSHSSDFPWILGTSSIFDSLTTIKSKSSGVNTAGALLMIVLFTFMFSIGPSSIDSTGPALPSISLFSYVTFTSSSESTTESAPPPPSTHLKGRGGGGEARQQPPPTSSTLSSSSSPFKGTGRALLSLNSLEADVVPTSFSNSTLMEERAFVQQ